MKTKSKTETWITCCSRKKKTDTRLMPAVERYESDRIKSVHKTANDKEFGFLILSGKYGLLRPQERIRWYDKLLTHDEVPALVDLVEGQLKEMGVIRVRYVTEDIDEDTRLRPYRDVMVSACKKAKLPCKVVDYKQEAGR